MLSDVLCEFTKSIGMETNMYAQLGGQTTCSYYYSPSCYTLVGSTKCARAMRLLWRRFSITTFAIVLVTFAIAHFELLI